MDDWILPTLDREACTRCGACVSQCPDHVVALRAGELAFANPESCTYCGVCETVCPRSAIALTYSIVWGDAVSPGKG